MPQPPVAAKHPVIRTLQGESFEDDYFWLREKDAAPVLEHLRAEAAYADAVMAPHAALVETLFKEIVSHIAEDDESAKVKDGAWRYWRRTAKGKSYPIYLREKIAADGTGGPEEVVLDLNVLAAGKPFLGIGTFETSPDGARLMYSTDETGFRQYDLRVRDLATGGDVPEVIPKTTAAAWAADGKTVFYVVEDHAKRPYRAYRHVVGTDPKGDALVYEETDERYELDCWLSQSGAYVVLHSGSMLTTEVRLVDAKRPEAAPILVAPRVEGQEYYVEHAPMPGDDRLVIRVNDTGPTYRLVTAPVATPGRDHWKQLRAVDPAVMLEELTAFQSFMVMEVREGGLPHLEVLAPDGHVLGRIAMPDAVYEVSLEQNPEFATREIRYAYQSLAVPRSVYVYDVGTTTSRLVKEDPVPGFDRAAYTTERRFATARDGTKIPISVVYKKGVTGPAPLHLYAYGAYGYSLPIAFSPARLTLLDRGVVYAVAHVRGGAELGKPWHEGGRLAHKINTFTDFIAAAAALRAPTADGTPSAGRLTIEGASAGGLLMGGVLNMRPDLFDAAIVGVPFVDVINTMNDPSLPLTITEYEEWGNPGIAEQYGWMRAYSPYDNLAARAYPPILVKTSYNDSQVMYWEPAKYVARLRALKTDDNPLIFKIHLDAAGHGGKSGRYDKYREVAYDQAFVLWQLGLAGR